MMKIKKIKRKSPWYKADSEFASSWLNFQSQVLSKASCWIVTGRWPGKLGADFTCPCLGHCETWLIHQKLTACRSHLLSHAIRVCKRAKWKLEKYAASAWEAKRNSEPCKGCLYTSSSAAQSTSSHLRRSIILNYVH